MKNQISAPANRIETKYSLAELKQRLFSGEEFAIMDEFHDTIQNALGEQILFRGTDGDIKSIRLVNKESYSWYTTSKETGYNVKRITDKFIHLYTIDVFGDVNSTKIERSRIVFSMDIPEYQAKLDKKKQQREEFRAWNKKQLEIRTKQFEAEHNLKLNAE